MPCLCLMHVSFFFVISAGAQALSRIKKNLHPGNALISIERPFSIAAFVKQRGVGNIADQASTTPNPDLCAHSGAAGSVGEVRS